MRSQSDAGRILHRVHRASLLIFKCLQPAQIVQSRCGWAAACETGGCDGAVLGDAYRNNIRMQLRTGVRRIEELLAQCVGRGWTCKSLVEQYRPVRHGLVEFS